MLKSGTQIKESPKKMDVSALMVNNANLPKTIHLNTLENEELFQKVIVNIKVLEAKKTIGDKTKQDVVVAEKMLNSTIQAAIN